MKSLSLSVLALATLAACADPTAQQAEVDARFTADRADQMLAFDFAPGSTRLDPSQEQQMHVLVANRHGRRDEFVIVTDGSGGSLQQSRATHVASRLSQAGAQWISAQADPSIARGPDQILEVRSEYLLGMRNCPTHTPSTMWNPNESLKPGYGCTDAYNLGQMLARPRDAAIGRDPGPADGTIGADSVQRYRESHVRTSTISVGGGAGGGGAAPPSP
jgi:type IV pilus biogenesis protein CpaD/CtpE